MPQIRFLVECFWQISYARRLLNCRIHLRQTIWIREEDAIEWAKHWGREKEESYLEETFYYEVIEEKNKSEELNFYWSLCDASSRRGVLGEKY